MASKVEIINRGLQRLGAKNIVSISDSSVNAIEANLAYDPVRLALLRKHQWNCAIKTFSLAADATTPDFGFNYSYTLPSDFIKLCAPYPSMKSEEMDWQVQNGKIFTNDSAPLQGRYVFDLTEPNSMDPLFREVLSCELAYQLCELLTQSNTKKADIMAEKKELILEAKKANAIEKIPIDLPDDTWITVRR